MNSGSCSQISDAIVQMSYLHKLLSNSPSNRVYYFQF